MEQLPPYIYGRYLGERIRLGKFEVEFGKNLAKDLKRLGINRV